VEFHAIGHDHGLSGDDLRGRLGELGAGLDTVARELAMATPDGFVIGAEQAAALVDDGWTDQALIALDSALGALESGTGRRLGDPSVPLYLALRGEERTLLDVGVNPANLPALADLVGSQSAAASRLCDYLERYGDIVLAADMAPFIKSLEAANTLSVGSHSPELLHILAQRHHRLLGDRFPDSALEQLKAAIVRLACGGPVVVQAMVHGDAMGVCSSRNLLTGEAEVSLAPGFDAVADEVVGMLRQAELHNRDAVELELIRRAGIVYVVGCAVANRSGVAAARIAHELTLDDEVGLTREEAVCRISATHVEQILHQSFGATVELEVLTTGLGASPGAAVGRVVFDADEAITVAARGESVILVAEETSPEDVHGMEVAAGILTTRGGLASHAAVVARGWGTPAVCGAEQIMLGHDVFTVGSTIVAKGDIISIDGSAGTIMAGEAATSSAEHSVEFNKILGWADKIRSGHLAVRANADTAADARKARDLGAEGIGLCRTEHMFLAVDRLPVVRQMILASSPAAEKMALTRLRLAQRDDFLEILEVMDGLPVTVRLLDPPLHEFLPDVEELAVAEARGDLDDDGLALLSAARLWSEKNPMIGTRGVRLGWLKPGLYEMQVRALMAAVSERVAAGGNPIVEVMIPLTVSAPELAGARRWVEDALDGEDAEFGHVSIGTMIETPRAALVAGALAEHADFFSFGTNDLTQLTYGFSRDDVEARIMALYIREGLLPSNPFERLDAEAVNELVKLGVERGRAAKSDLKIGLCGEHGGDPESVALCLEAGLDYVSCSPYRVPVARLAAAQAVIASQKQ